MKWTIDRGSMPSYLRVETDGKASIDDFAAMWDAILACESWHPGLTVLMDNRKLTPLEDADAFTEAGIEYFTKNADRVGKAFISVIVSEADNFKYARQFQYGIRLRGSDVALQIFGSEARALEWLDHYFVLHEHESSSAGM